VNAQFDEAQVKARVASAAGATAITALLFVCLGALFSAPAAARPGTLAYEAAAPTAPAIAAFSGASVARGRYLAATAGCNDCHTGGYAESGGKVPEKEWLTGVPVGYQGPWGTSYPANLRLTVQSMTEAQWMTFARAERLPPMPWFALRDMSDDDVRSLYRFIRSLGAKGTRAPAAVGPSGKVMTPYILFVPQGLPTQAVSQVKPVTRDTRG